jgi:hypothetical protein
MLFLNSTEKRRNNEKNLIEFIDKKLIDCLVYELYLKERFNEDDIKSNLCVYVEPYLQDISHVTSEEQKLKIIKEAIGKIENDKRIMRQIEEIKSHSWVRRIETSAKP